MKWIIVKGHLHNSSNEMQESSSEQQQGMLSQWDFNWVSTFFNILNVHYEEIDLEICSCHLGCKLPLAIRFWRAKCAHPCKSGNCSSVPFLCLFLFVWMFSLLYFSSLPLLFLSEYSAPRGERWKKRILSHFVLSFSICEMGIHTRLENFLLHLHITWHCSLSSLPLTQTQNQAVAAFSGSNLPWAKTRWQHILPKLSREQNLNFWHLLNVRM